MLNRARSGRGLPTGRALVGALLVAVAVLGTFALGNDGHDSTVAYVVARTSIDAGQVIAAEDLTTRRLHLDPDVADGAFVDSGAIVGSVALAALEPGDLVQRSVVGPSGPGESGRFELTLTVPTGATPPSLRRGERVTILATLGSGADATTRAVLEAIEVVDLRSVDDLGGGDMVLTVALDDPALLVAGAHAAQVGEITVIRMTGSPIEGLAPVSSAELTATTTTTVPG